MTNSPLRNLLEQWWSCLCLDLENKSDMEIVTELEEFIVEFFTFEREEYIGEYGYPKQYVEGFNHMVELVEEKFGIFEDNPKVIPIEIEGSTGTPRWYYVVKQEVEKPQKKNWYVDAKTLLKSNWTPTPQHPEQVAQSLKEVMRKAIDDGIIPSREELEKEAENYMKLKNLLKAIDEYFDENKPPTLKERFEEYLQKGDFAQSYHVIANELVDIVKEFIPPSSTTNSYEWERCLKTIRDKLR